MRGPLISIFLLLSVGLACTKTRPAILYGKPIFLTAEDYPAVLDTWTRSTKVYQGLETKLFVNGTFHAPEFRRSFAVAFPEIYGHGGKITRRELVDLSDGVEQFHNFFLSVYTPVLDWNDLSRSESIWRLTLIGDDEVAVGPAEIISVKIDANLEAVYPYLTRFDKGYLVRFPLADAMKRLLIQPGSKKLVLRLASALGSAELQWDFAQARPEQPAPGTTPAPEPSPAP